MGGGGGVRYWCPKVIISDWYQKNYDKMRIEPNMVCAWSLKRTRVVGGYCNTCNYFGHSKTKQNKC